VDINNSELDKAEEQVLDTVQSAESTFSPKDLIGHLTQEGLSEDIVRRATWYLIDRKEIELTPEWTLHSTSTPDTV